MICPNCGHRNPNGYMESCKSCRQPLIVPAVVKEEPKLAKTAKTVKKAKTPKKA